MSWLFVPRLRAQGWLRIGGREHRIENDLAYHDHNWGRFWWGDDFGWTWGTLLPTRPDDPWSMVFLQMTDRSRLRCLSQRSTSGTTMNPPRIPARRGEDAFGWPARPRGRLHLPPPMRRSWTARCRAYRADRDHRDTGGDTVHAEFRAHRMPAWPSPARRSRPIDGVCEASGTARASGTINGEDVDFVGTGVFEFLYG